MSPIAVHDDRNVGPEVFANFKAKASVVADQAPLPDHGVPVKPDYMYKFKYNHPLPTHGTEGLEIAIDADATAVANELIAELSHVLSQGDAKGFSELFLEHGVWRDRAAITWDYRSFNFRSAIRKAATDLFPSTPISKVALTAPTPKIERPYEDLSYVQFQLSFETDKVGASALVNAIMTKEGYKIWTLNTAIESLVRFPELQNRDGHMTGPHSWTAQREIDSNMDGVEPEVLIIGGGQK
jgi:hypothetical protein